jgi:hypothetical protein
MELKWRYMRESPHSKWVTPGAWVVKRDGDQETLIHCLGESRYVKCSPHEARAIAENVLRARRMGADGWTVGLAEENSKLRNLLIEAVIRVSDHHAAHLVSWEGHRCPVCAEDNLFERIDEALGKPANDPSSAKARP